MRRRIAGAIGALGFFLVGGEAAALQFDPPKIMGTLVGAAAHYPSQPNLQMYGTDLGWSFEHAGELQILFGDTWAHANSLCDPPPNNDDSQGLLEDPWKDRNSLPNLRFEMTSTDPTLLQPLEIFRDNVSLQMGWGQVPQTGFSDGDNAYAVFSRASFVACDPTASPQCSEGLVCAPNVGICTTFPGLPPALCNAGTGAGCTPFITVCDGSGPGYCMDPNSSQYIGSQDSERFAVAHEMEIGLQEVSPLTEYNSAAVFETNKFTNMTTRGVTHFTGSSSGNDYRPSATPDTLFIWGRPWFLAEQGRQAQLYLLRHDLPLLPDATGKIQFAPEYFSGLDSSGEPLFDTNPTAAMPLALDGASDPTESREIVSQMAVSWIDSPIKKWVMLYGGDLPDFFLTEPGAVNPANRGPILIRYADHPWGPWSPAQPLLSPGSASVAGSPYGPGGVLFHNDCVDSVSLDCARSDPFRPPNLLSNFFCIPPLEETDIGRFYGPNIIDAYTELAGDHANIYWNVSTWNPYAAVLVKTTLRPGGAGLPPCGDGSCEGGEDSVSCPLDCGAPAAPASCGDGTCDASETSCSCEADCGAPAPGSCGNGAGSEGEARAGGCSLSPEDYSGKGKGQAGVKICLLTLLAALALKRSRLSWLAY